MFSATEVGAVSAAEAINVTQDQAVGIINTGSSTASANAFYDLVKVDLGPTMTQTKFVGLYKPNFVEFDLADFNTLLSGYVAAVKAENYVSAEENLVKLAAASFKNMNTRYVPEALEDEKDPWGSGKQFFTYNPAIEGSLYEDFAQSFADQFDHLFDYLVEHHVVLPRGGPVVDPPPVTSASGSPMLEAKNKAVAKISGYQKDAISEMADKAEKLTTTVNGIKTSALADSDIGTATTEQKYIRDVDNAVSGGKTSIRGIATTYLDDITTADNSANTRLDLLASGDTNSAAVYKLDISDQETESKNAITKARDGHITALNTLEKSVTEAINSKGASPSTDDDGESAGEFIADVFKDGLGEGLVAIGTALVVYYRKKIAFKLGLSSEDPEIPASLKRFSSAIEKANGKLDEAFEKLPSSEVVRDVISGNKSLREGLSESFQKALDMDPAEYQAMLARIPGGSDAVNAASERLGNLSRKLSDIVSKVEDVVPGVSKGDILKKVGDALGQDGVIDADGNINIEAVVGKVKGAIQSGDSTFSTGSGGTGADTDADSVFEKITGSTKAELKEQIQSRITEEKLTKSAFHEQVEALEAKVDEMKSRESDLDEAERTQLADDQAKLDAATEAEEDPATHFEPEV